MKPESEALLNYLLARHHDLCVTGNEPTTQCTVSYGEMCADAGVPHIVRPVGSFLQEVAQWCADRAYPPINSLAVNDETGIPGERYDLAPGCSNINWPEEVRACISFRGYPESIAEAAAP